VYRVISDTYKAELRNEEEKLSECLLYHNSKLAVEKGKPLRQGEIPCKWILYDLIKDTKYDLFDLALPGKLMIKEVKEALVKYWIEANEQTKRKDNVVFTDDPSRLRFRNVYGSRPSSIHMDHKTLKDVAGRYFASEVYVQILPEGKTETKTSEDTVVIILRQFHPDKYELGPSWEFDAYNDEKLGDFRDRISTLTSIPAASLALASADLFDIQKILRVPSLKWHPRADDSEPNEKKIPLFIPRHLRPQQTCTFTEFIRGRYDIISGSICTLVQVN